jgi:catechol 2,3-dioxygenase-like lactoylglutathione lyase family enzyme
MPDRPRFAMIVSDITASLKFYISYLGFTAVESQPESGMATMLDSDGDPILLAGPAINDVRSYLDEPRIFSTYYLTQCTRQRVNLFFGVVEAGRDAQGLHGWDAADEDVVVVAQALHNPIWGVAFQTE